MLITIRKWKGSKQIAVYMKNKRLEQVKTIKYLGTIIDCNMKFKEHISYISQQCTKLIHVLSNSAKLKWD